MTAREEELKNGTAKLHKLIVLHKKGKRVKPVSNPHDDRTKNPTDRLFIPNAGMRRIALKENTAAPNVPQATSALPSVVTQEDLIELLSLRLLYERKFAAIEAAIKAGASVELGVHEAHLDTRLVAR